MKIDIVLRTLAFLVAALLSMPAVAAQPPAGAPQPARSDGVPEQLLRSMTLDEKLAQMVVSYPPLDPEAPVTVGAVIIVGKLLRSPEAMRAKIADLQRRARIPLLVSVDMEGGKFNRLKHVAELKAVPSNRELGRLKERDLEAWGRKVGKGMRGVGFNCNLGPVLDLAESGLMHESERSMGADVSRVARLGRAYARGLWAEGVVPIGKHFPGYGPLDLNSDHHFVLTDRSKAEIAQHADAFVRVGNELGGVMLANVGFNAYGAVPAILSSDIVALAQQHGWVTITDDLAVSSLAEVTGGDAEEVVRRAFLAGNDLLLTTAPIDWDKGLDYRRILRDLVAARPDLLPRVDASVLRILRLKERAGLLEDLRGSVASASPAASPASGTGVATEPAGPTAGTAF